MPVGVVGKGWNTLLSPSLNIAWLPANEVFLPHPAGAGRPPG